MGVKVITESGAEIQLPPEIVAESDPAVIDAYVAGEIAKLEDSVVRLAAAASVTPVSDPAAAPADNA
jgi:hypothetical protein